MTTQARPLRSRFGRAASAILGEPHAAASPAAIADDAHADERRAEAATSDEVRDAEADPAVDHLHNRENPSAAEMAEMLREVQDSLAALDERLAGLEGAQGESSLVTRRLALNIAQMGETLARRVRSLEHGHTAARPPAPPTPPPPAPPAAATPAPTPFAPALAPRPAPVGRKKGGRWDTLALILGVAILLGLIGIGLWVFGRQHAGGGSTNRAAAIAAPVATSLPPPPVAVAPAATAPPVTHKAAAPYSARTPRHYSFYPTHRGFIHHAPPPAAGADSPAPAGFGSFGPAATNNPPKPQI
jgi:hypothetical protein